MKVCNEGVRGRRKKNNIFQAFYHHYDMCCNNVDKVGFITPENIKEERFPPNPCVMLN